MYGQRESLLDVPEHPLDFNTGDVLRRELATDNNGMVGGIVDIEVLCNM